MMVKRRFISGNLNVYFPFNIVIFFESYRKLPVSFRDFKFFVDF